jgi:hypothetical protein
MRWRMRSNIHPCKYIMNAKWNLFWMHNILRITIRSIILYENTFVVQFLHNLRYINESHA